ncbi:MAG: hypothetical protein IT445_15140 [Phycisphaeraceae bacterium]|nr:hypothetical protein [Phycisphaeraceae bacterium]
MMAMIQAYEREIHAEVIEHLRLAAGYMQVKSVGPIEGHPDLLAVWEPSSSSHWYDAPNVPVKRDKAKLGGAGLALVALCSLEAHSPGVSDLEMLRAIGRFILFLQQENGKFYSRYLPNGPGLDTEWVSLYYPGEAALGLIMLYELDGDIRWLDGAVKALVYLASERSETSDIPADHWALLATARLWPHLSETHPANNRDLLIRHAKQICKTMLDGSFEDADDTALVGSLGYLGQTTPTAIRLEGMLAVVDLVGNSDPEFRERITTAAEDGVAFLLRSQITEGEFSGAIPRAIKGKPSHAEVAREADGRATEVRIDYVQHALSALIAYERLLSKPHQQR